MRRREYFHGLRVPEENWTILRLDGRKFSKFTKEHFEKPFDQRFHELMLHTAQRLCDEFRAVYCYTESDEISLLLPYSWDMFDRELEKILSISASVASSAFTLKSQLESHFDSRVWIAGQVETVVDYFSWRQADAYRCALNGWAYWLLRQDGLKAAEATARLDGLKNRDKHEILFQHEINFNDLPGWQKRGTGIYLQSYQKKGFNPVEKVETLVTRRRWFVDENIPYGDHYREFLDACIAGFEALRA